MSQGSPYQYSAADIRRYVEGKMSPAEMHAMEKAALEDPFLADAMEGYQASLPAAADVDALKTRLAERIAPARVVPMRPRPWLSMAAAVLVLLGMAYALWVTMDAPQTPTIAKVESAETKVESITDTTTPARAEAPAPAVAALEKKPAGKEQARPIPQPSPPPPAAAAEPPVVTGYATKPADKAEDQARLSEVVVTREEEAKRLRAAPLAAPKAAQAKSRQADSAARVYAEPADGWSAFEVYVMNNMRRPKEPLLHGNVVLSFMVNPDTGKPYDIKVDKALHPLYDKEAIRLLKEGPVWAVYNTENPVKSTYTVVF